MHMCLDVFFSSERDALKWQSKKQNGIHVVYYRNKNDFFIKRLFFLCMEHRVYIPICVYVNIGWFSCPISYILGRRQISSSLAMTLLSVVKTIWLVQGCRPFTTAVLWRSMSFVRHLPVFQALASFSYHQAILFVLCQSTTSLLSQHTALEPLDRSTWAE